MRIAVIGCVVFSESVLSLLLTLDFPVVGVVTREASDFNADFRDLGPLCLSHGIDCLKTTRINSPESVAWLSEREPDLILCVGWSYLLKRPVLDIPSLGVVGYHPTALPKNRGRHPLIWALCLGLENTASSFFLMDEGADSGPIVSQTTVPIHFEDDAASLYQRVSAAALEQLKDFLPRLADGSLKPQEQDHERANVWRKRSAKDGFIDFRMSGPAIHNLVRALTRPYVGAHVSLSGVEGKVWKVKLESCEEKNLEPGKVLALNGSDITVKCDGGAVVLTEHEISPLPEVGAYFD